MKTITEKNTLWNKAIEGVSWLACFNLIAQTFSWVVTILVARVLLPDDYGLMALATIFTGYALMFSEVGLGAAIIQKTSTSEDELSSVFWFGLLVSLIFAICGIPLAYITASLFNEDRIIPLTLTVSVVFIFSGLQIVPLNLLKKKLEYKTIGFIQLSSVLISCCFMLTCAYMGGGVWTLVGGQVILSFSKLILTYNSLRWFPKWHFVFHEAKPYIKFGVLVAMGRSMFYIWEKSDRFFIGKFWAPKTVGYYTFALQLAQLPTEKITVFINQVSYPIFSRLKNSLKEFKFYYLKVVKITMVVVLPLFVGGYLVSTELVIVVLGEKWLPIVFIFKFLCLNQIVTSLNAVNSFVHNAQGRPQWSMCFHAICAVILPVAFYFAAKHGLNAMLVPWFTVYLAVCFVWICITLRKIDISISVYLKNLIHPCIGVLVMFVVVSGYTILLDNLSGFFVYNLSILIGKIVVGGVVYTLYLIFFDIELINDLRTFKKGSTKTSLASCRA